MDLIQPTKYLYFTSIKTPPNSTNIVVRMYFHLLSSLVWTGLVLPLIKWMKHNIKHKIMIAFKILALISLSEASREISILTLPKNKSVELVIPPEISQGWIFINIIMWRIINDVLRTISSANNLTLCTFFKTEYSSLTQDVSLFQIKVSFFIFIPPSQIVFYCEIFSLQETLELGLYKDLKSGWVKTSSDLAIFDVVSASPRTWHGICARISDDRLLVRINNASVLTTSITRSTNSQEIAVPAAYYLLSLSLPIRFIVDIWGQDCQDRRRTGRVKAPTEWRVGAGAGRDCPRDRGVRGGTSVGRFSQL